MTADAQPLTAVLLERFRAALRHAGAPLGDEIQPGLSDAEIDKIGAELGADVPPELRTLWRWGTAPEQPQTDDSCDINNQLELWSPSYAITRTRQHRQSKPDVRRPTIAFGGPATHGWYLVDGDPEAIASPVTYSLIDDSELITAAPSLGVLVEHWTRQLAQRAYYYDDERWYPDDGPRPFPGG